jgi:hypothetical protein
MKLGDIKVTTAIFFALVGATIYKFGLVITGEVILGLISLALTCVALVYITKSLVEYVKTNGAPAIGLLTLVALTWIVVGIHYVVQ